MFDLIKVLLDFFFWIEKFVLYILYKNKLENNDNLYVRDENKILLYYNQYNFNYGYGFDMLIN